MNGRIDDKIKEVEELLSELDLVKANSVEQYLADIKTRAACERYFEKIIEAVIDLSFLVIKEKKFKEPKEDEDALKILAENKIIEENLYSRLRNARGMRNFIIHQYEKINDELVYEAITKDLEKDVNEFLEDIRRVIR